MRNEGALEDVEETSVQRLAGSRENLKCVGCPPFEVRYVPNHEQERLQ